MNDNQARAMLGVIMAQVDMIIHGIITSAGISDPNFKPGTPDEYMAIAQTYLTSSYKNYQPPTGGDQQEVDKALALIASKGYTFISPGDASTPQSPEVASQPQPST